MDSLIELRSKRGKLLDQATAIVEEVGKAGAEYTKEKRAEVKTLTDQAQDLLNQIQSIEGVRAASATLNQVDKPKSAPGVDLDPRLGLTDKETKRFSILRVAQSLAGMDVDAGFERECSDGVVKKLGRESRGFFLPYEIMERRDTRAATVLKTIAGQGGYLIDTELLTKNFIELLRVRMLTQQAGALMLSGLVGDVQIPKQVGGATVYHIAEDGSPTASGLTVGQVNLNPKTIGAVTDITRKMLLQVDNPSIDTFVMNDMATVLAIAMDNDGINGPGNANYPRGILRTVGIGDVAGGTNGLAIAWTHLVGLETKVATANADVGNLAYFMNAAARGFLKVTPKIGSTYPIFLWDTTASAATPINGYKVYVTNQIPSTLTKGTTTTCTAVIFGNWNELIYGLWGSLELIKDPYSLSTSGGVRIVGLQDFDVAVRHQESFAAMQDALTA
jgi:HK97 family phage major capsid protein